MWVCFRVDASKELGIGHVSRCLSLADALRASGATCQFICSELPEFIREKIVRHGHNVSIFSSKDKKISLNPKPRVQKSTESRLMEDWVEDAKLTEKHFGSLTPDWLIVDHYSLDSRWESMMRNKSARLMVIDDLADRQHECDLLLDQNLVANWQSRYKEKVPDSCVLLLGPQFALLQKMYSDLRPFVKTRKGEIRRVLIHFGGTASSELSDLVLSVLQGLRYSEIKVDVVAGDLEDSLGLRSSGLRSSITFHTMVESLAPLILDADLFIGAGGATTWERCCLGLPSIVISVADNQEEVAAELNRLGIIRWIGGHENVSIQTIENTLESVFGQPLNPEWSLMAQELVDGFGCDRVVRYLQESG